MKPGNSYPLNARSAKRRPHAGDHRFKTRLLVSRWVVCKLKFFLAVWALSRFFRRRFLEGLLALHEARRLAFLGDLADPGAFRADLTSVSRDGAFWGNRSVGSPAAGAACALHSRDSRGTSPPETAPRNTSEEIAPHPVGRAIGGGRAMESAIKMSAKIPLANCTARSIGACAQSLACKPSRNDAKATKPNQQVTGKAASRPSALAGAPVIAPRSELVPLDWTAPRGN